MQEWASLGPFVPEGGARKNGGGGGRMIEREGITKAGV